MNRSSFRALVFAAVTSLSLAGAASAEQRFALVISGASGGKEYAAQYANWTDSLLQVLTGRLKMSADSVTVLSDSDQPSLAATADNVRGILGALRTKMTRDDLLVIVLIGHGTFDGVDAKFNLVGRDLESAEWGALLKNIPGRLVVVNTTAGSFPFIERLAAPRRIVISATDSVAQRFDTVFPQYFIKAFEDESADLDKNGRISIWEAFASASAVSSISASTTHAPSPSKRRAVARPIPPAPPVTSAIWPASDFGFGMRWSLASSSSQYSMSNASCSLSPW